MKSYLKVAKIEKHKLKPLEDIIVVQISEYAFREQYGRIGILKNIRKNPNGHYVYTIELKETVSRFLTISDFLAKHFQVLSITRTQLKKNNEEYDYYFNVIPCRGFKKLKKEIQ